MHPVSVGPSSPHSHASGVYGTSHNHEHIFALRMYHSITKHTYNNGTLKSIIIHNIYLFEVHQNKSK